MDVREPWTSTGRFDEPDFGAACFFFFSKKKFVCNKDESNLKVPCES